MTELATQPQGMVTLCPRRHHREIQDAGKNSWVDIKRTG